MNNNEIEEEILALLDELRSNNYDSNKLIKLIDLLNEYNQIYEKKLNNLINNEINDNIIDNIIISFFDTLITINDYKIKKKLIKLNILKILYLYFNLWYNIILLQKNDENLIKIDKILPLILIHLKDWPITFNTLQNSNILSILKKIKKLKKKYYKNINQLKDMIENLINTWHTLLKNTDTEDDENNNKKKKKKRKLKDDDDDKNNNNNNNNNNKKLKIETDENKNSYENEILGLILKDEKTEKKKKKKKKKSVKWADKNGEDLVHIKFIPSRKEIAESQKSSQKNKQLDDDDNLSTFEKARKYRSIQRQILEERKKKMEENEIKKKKKEDEQRIKQLQITKEWENPNKFILTPLQNINIEIISKEINIQNERIKKLLMPIEYLRDDLIPDSPMEPIVKLQSSYKKVEVEPIKKISLGTFEKSTRIATISMQNLQNLLKSLHPLVLKEISTKKELIKGMMISDDSIDLLKFRRLINDIQKKLNITSTPSPNTNNTQNIQIQQPLLPIMNQQSIYPMNTINTMNMPISSQSQPRFPMNQQNIMNIRPPMQQIPQQIPQQHMQQHIQQRPHLQIPQHMQQLPIQFQNQPRMFPRNQFMMNNNFNQMNNQMINNNNNNHQQNISNQSRNMKPPLLQQNPPNYNKK